MNAPAVALACLAAVLSATGPAAGVEPLCDPSPVAAALLAGVEEQPARELSGPEWEERLAAVEGALAERPRDLFLHRLRQDLVRAAPKDHRQERLPALREEYARLRERYPEDPVFLYLYGRFTHDGLAARREAYHASLAADPELPWAHLELVALDAWTGKAAEGVDGHLARFAELCPGRVADLLHYGSPAGSPAFWAERLPEIGRRVRRAPEEHLSAFPDLWALEFRAVDLAEHGPVRERVAADVQALERLGSEAPGLLRVLQTGYELTGREEKAAAIDAELLAAAPCSSRAVYQALAAWDEVHPSLGEEAGGEDRRARRRERLEATRTWIERCPDQYPFWSAHLDALAALEDAAPAEVLAAGERAATLYARSRLYSRPTGYEKVAEVFLERRPSEDSLDRATELLDRAEAESAIRREQRDLSLYPQDLVEEVDRANRDSDWSRELLRTRVEIARGELDGAASALAELGATLAERAPRPDSGGRAALAHRGFESAHAEARAELAEARGRLPDAVAFLLEAEEARPADAPAWVQGPPVGEAAERAAALWAKLGGSPAGLAAFRRLHAATAGEAPGRLADFSPWQTVDDPLPAFALEDLAGRVWTSADLAGKTVFVNAWATWCGPCRQELPAVQALHERLRERDDVLVITLNSDTNTGAILPYVETSGFDFPVLLAADYLRDELEVFAIPESWIVDPAGTRRREQTGFDASIPEEAWVDQVLTEMEELAAGPPSRR